MDTRVVLVTRLKSALGMSGEHDGLAVADLRHPDAVEGMLRQLHSRGVVPIVVCRAQDYEDVRLQVTFAQARFPGLRCALETVAGQPLAVSIVASLAADLRADRDSSAWQLAAIDYLRERQWSGVWLPKVGGLTSPAPSLWQHARSWLPGGGFLAIDGPPGRVVKATSAPLTSVGDLHGSVLLHTPAASSSAWVVDAVRRALGAGSATETDPVREPIDTYGTELAVEFVAVPQSYDSDSRPAPDAIIECSACGLRHARAACPVCGMTAEPLELRREQQGVSL